MAYILVQHLDPAHESILAELLQKVTKIPVQEIVDNIHVEADHIYIIPSNKLLTATDGVLQLSERLPKNFKNMPIDVFSNHWQMYIKAMQLVWYCQVLQRMEH